MNPKEYIEKASMTDLQARDYTHLYYSRLSDKTLLRLLHASMGLTTEVGELTDALKKHLFYGKKLDVTNLIEECGDLFWYIALLLKTLGVSMEQVMKLNIDKLSIRYPDKFDEKRANNRDLKAERKALKKGISK